MIIGFIILILQSWVYISYILLALERTLVVQHSVVGKSSCLPRFPWSFNRRVLPSSLPLAQAYLHYLPHAIYAKAHGFN